MVRLYRNIEHHGKKYVVQLTDTFSGRSIKVLGKLVGIGVCPKAVDEAIVMDELGKNAFTASIMVKRGRTPPQIADYHRFSQSFRRSCPSLVYKELPGLANKPIKQEVLNAVYQNDVNRGMIRFAREYKLDPEQILSLPKN